MTRPSVISYLDQFPQRRAVSGPLDRLRGAMMTGRGLALAYLRLGDPTGMIFISSELSYRFILCLEALCVVPCYEME